MYHGKIAYKSHIHPFPLLHVHDTTPRQMGEFKGESDAESPFDFPFTTIFRETTRPGGLSASSLTFEGWCESCDCSRLSGYASGGDNDVILLSPDGGLGRYKPPSLANGPRNWFTSLFSFASLNFCFLFSSRSSLSRLSTRSCSTHASIPAAADSGVFLQDRRYPWSSAVENSCWGTPAAKVSASLGKVEEGFSGV